MKRLSLAALALVCTPLFAADPDYKVDPQLDKAVRAALPVCAETTLSYDALPLRLPQRFTGSVVTMSSKRRSCEGQLVSVLSPTGGLFVGMPWDISGEEGATPEEKLKHFMYRNMQETVTPVIDRTTATSDGLYRVTLLATTENGKMPLEGELDREGRIFFFGHFRRANADINAQRLKAFEQFLPASPARGADKPQVTVVEFSDFECPSCRRASAYLEPILAKHGDKVRYVRYDLPLTAHPWAFAAALAGRAIYRQKPEVFWDYKKQVYANQENLNAFLFWDWARNFAEDHDLDLKRYDADLGSQELKDLILKGEGTAFANDIRATPTYMVNGAIVDAGEEGAALAEYVESLLK
ncbi:MAG TPA: thioredoxin domain-containing protein [Thermoanaerobaculia bacterium]